MSVEKEKLLIEYLISSVDVFGLCQPIIKPTFFDPTLRKSIEFLLDYYNQYRAIASCSQIEAESGTKLSVHELTTDQTEYCIAEVEQFCKHAAIKKAIMDSVELYEKEDYGKIEANIKAAITLSVHKRAGVGLFEETASLLEKLKQSPPIPTHYTEFDNILGGGLRRKEMLLLSANSGGGKSIVMANFGLNYAMYSRKSVLYVSYELPVEMIAKRYFSMVTGVSQVELVNQGSVVIELMDQNGHKIPHDLVIEKLPVGTTPNGLRSFLKEFELRRKHVPDVLILDYLDLMSPNEKVSADNVSEKDKQVAEQVHQILDDYDMIGITASQQNRSAVTATDLNHSHIAGGITKINTTDIYASIIFNDLMKAAGEIHIEFLKTRSSDGVGKRIELKWNNTALRVENMNSNAFRLNSPKRQLNQPTKEVVVPESRLKDFLDM